MREERATMLQVRPKTDTSTQQDRLVQRMSKDKAFHYLKRREPWHSKMMKSVERTLGSTIKGGISEIESADLKNVGSIARS
jgi:hypothetical protein